MISTLQPKDNKKRGLLNFVGTAGHALFGLATNDQIQQIYNHLKKLAHAIDSSWTDKDVFEHQLGLLGDKLDRKIVDITHALNGTATATYKIGKTMEKVENGDASDKRSGRTI